MRFFFAVYTFLASHSALASQPEFLFEGGYVNCAYELVSGGADRYVFNGFSANVEGSLRLRNDDGTLGEVTTVSFPIEPSKRSGRPIAGTSLIRAEIKTQEKSLSLFFPHTLLVEDSTTPAEVCLGKSTNLFFDNEDWNRYLDGEEVEIFLSETDFNIAWLYALTLSGVPEIKVSGQSVDFRKLYRFERDGSFSVGRPENLTRGSVAVAKDGEFPGAKAKVRRGKSFTLLLESVRARVSYEKPEFRAVRRRDNYRGVRFAQYLDKPDEIFEKRLDVTNWPEEDVKKLLLFLRFHEANITVTQKSGSAVKLWIFRTHPKSEVSADWYVTEKGVKNSSYDWTVPFSDIGTILVTDIDDYVSRRADKSQINLDARIRSGFVPGDVFVVSKLPPESASAMFAAFRQSGASLEVTYIPEELLLGEPKFNGIVVRVDATSGTVGFKTTDGWGEEEIVTYRLEELAEVMVLKIP